MLYYFTYTTGNSFFFSFIIVVDSTTERPFGFCQCFSQVGSESIKGNLIGFI